MTQISERQLADIGLLFEDNEVLVVSKPAGINTHAVSETDNSPNIASILADKLADNDPIRGGIVHRLDKDTSGVMILAKTTEALEYLQAQFRARRVKKTYLGLVWGQLKHLRAKLELPIKRSPKTPTKMMIHFSGKNSLTEYRTLKRSSDFSYLEIELKTGRTHQIRVQFAHLGHPIVGDKKYSNKSLPAGLARQFLHAHSLAIKLPNGKSKTFTAPLPEDLKGFLRSIQWKT